MLEVFCERETSQGASNLAGLKKLPEMPQS